MEGTPLYNTLQSLEKPQPLESFLAPIDVVTVVIHAGQREKTVELTDLAPFHTLEDLQRALWLAQGKPEELFPRYTYWAYEKEDTLAPVHHLFFEITETETQSLLLPDPREVIPTRAILDNFVDEEGRKRPSLSERPRGRSTLEEVFLKPEGYIPVLHCFPYKSLLASYTGMRPISDLHWYGLFYPYFPRVEKGSTGTLTAEDLQQKPLLETFIYGKLTQARMLETLLGEVDQRELRTHAVRLLTLQWTSVKTESEFRGVDALFFANPVNATRPYMRLMAPNTTPITKLYQGDPLQPPAVSDPILLQSWSKESNPLAGQSMLMIKIKLRETPTPLYATLQVFDDSTAVFTVQPPAHEKTLDFRRDLSQLGELLEATAQDLPFNLQEARLGRLALSMDIPLDTTPPMDFRRQIAKRMSLLNTLFQPILPPTEDANKPFLSYRYKAISNFTRDDRIYSYLNYIFARRELQRETLHTVIPDLAREFQISEEEAQERITEYIHLATKVTTVDEDGKDFLALHNPGIDFSLYSASYNTYRVQLFNVRAISTEDLLRVTTILGLVFYGTEELWDSVMTEKSMSKQERERFEQASVQLEMEAGKEDDAAVEGGKEGDEVGSLTYEGSDDEALEGLEGLEELENLGEEEVPPPAAAKINKVKEKAAAPAAAAVAAAPTKIVAHGWFISHLQALDPELFTYTSATGEEAPKEKTYSTKCANNEDRYPIGLTEEQYQKMRKIYAKAEAEGRVAFIVYGVPNTDTMVEQAKGKENVITVLRHGSTPTNLHYYLCTPILCLRDLLPLLKEDFYDSITDYYGNPKPKKSCPFCHGTEIKNRKSPEEGETVFLRKIKPNEESAKVWIRFLADAKHPKGYDLPCCFLVRKDIGWEDAKFNYLRSALSRVDTAVEEEEEEKAAKAADLEEAYRGRKQFLVDYGVLRWKIGNEYILGPEKYPLAPGKIGMPSLELDSFFGQDSSQQVARLKVKRTFKRLAHGFFRVGVLNKVGSTKQSLFAALAPLLGMSTIQDVAKHFTERITPRVFLNLNFGNLVLEFYDPNEKEVSKQKLSEWSRKHLLIPPVGKAGVFPEQELSRFYNAYHNFIRYINDPEQKKQLRHFVHALAEPPKNIEEAGLVTPQGLTLMVLYYKGNPRAATTPIEVLCPLSGMDLQRYNNNLVGFLTYSDEGIWEPLVYVDHLSQTDTARSEAMYTIAQEQMLEPDFPPVARDRYMKEFLTRCQSAFRGAFTLQSCVDNRVLVPLTRAFELLNSSSIPITGIVKDAYNHIVALTLYSPAGEVLVPVIDDGNTFHNNTALKIYLGVSQVNWAPANEVWRIYSTVIEPRFGTLSEAYRFSSFKEVGGRIIGFQLGLKRAEESENTDTKEEEETPQSKACPTGTTAILLPCGAARADLEAIPEEIIERQPGNPDTYPFEYRLNHEILFTVNHESYDEGQESTFVLHRKQIEQLYEHFRLSFSNWIATQGNAELRQKIEDLLAIKPWDRSTLPKPNWEKKRILGMTLKPILENWLEASGKGGDTQNVLIRNDCIAIDEDESQCTGACKMVEGTCKIHIPEQVQVRSSPRLTTMPAKEYFIQRLFDEILRLPAKRHELMTRSVKHLQIPTKNLHVGDQWILPENTVAWYDLLREKEVGGPEKPQFYEEMSRQEVSEEELNTLGSVTFLRPVPPSVLALLPLGSEKALAVRVIQITEEITRGKALMNYFGIRCDPEKNQNTLSEGCITLISERSGVPVIQILSQVETPVIVGRTEKGRFTPKTSAYVILPDLPEGPGFLVLKDSIQDLIPATFLEGSLFNSIEAKPVILRKPKFPGKRPKANEEQV